MKGCYVGVKPDGTSGAGNASGISILDASNTTIGGPDNGEGNMISGNGVHGVFVNAGVTIQGNRIGLDTNGDPLGNIEGGILIRGSDATIGGTGSGENNVIAHNGGNGISLVTFNNSTPLRNTVRGNQIYNNGGLGIDLSDDARTTNDPGDDDDGENHLQNHPEIQSADYDPGTDEVTVTYLIDSTPNLTDPGASTYPLKVDFYRADSDGQEGEAHLGSDTYDANDYGGCGNPPCTVTITFTPNASVSTDDKVTATATDDNNNTSELSPASSQLPVELASFEVTTAGEDAVQLTWATISETNNAGFQIQRHVGELERESESRWTTVGWKDGSGTTTKAQSYGFTDAELPYETDRLTYRLKQVDTDGATHYSKTVTIEREVSKVQLLGTAPNPAQKQATLRYALPEEQELIIRLYDITGRQVRTIANETKQGRHEHSLDVSGLSSGTYILRLQAEGKVKTQKLTILR